MEPEDQIDVWLQQEKRNLEAMADSAVFAGLITPNYLDDPRCMLQIGAAVCLNKPICLILLDGVEPPPKVFQIADKVIFATKATMGAATEELGEYIKTQLPLGGE